MNRRTRQRILESAATLLAEEGLKPGLLERSAEAAEIPEETAHIFFRRDEDIILALFLREATALEDRVPELPEGPLSERFYAILSAKLAGIEPLREPFSALLATLLDPRQELGVLSPQTEIVRSRVMGVFHAVVLGASDAPPEKTDVLSRQLYGLYLGLLLLWTQDRAPGSPAVKAALQMARDLLKMIGPFLAQPAFQTEIERFDTVFGALVEQTVAPEINAKAEAILRLLFHHRRLAPEAGACESTPCPQCFALSLPRVRRFVSLNEPIHALLPAFPAKSPSRNKVLGALPDRAEEIALEYLQTICDSIQAIYPPGVRITICSDGHVFSDLVGVSDEEVSAYGHEISAMIARLNLPSLDTFGLEDLFDRGDFTAMREQLLAHYAEPLSTLSERAKQHPHHASLLNGIERFLLEEGFPGEKPKSKTQMRKVAHQRALQVVQRSDAWGRVVSECFPAALRLSIHPQPPHAEKIGILLGDAAGDNWITPWHGTAVRENERWTLEKRHLAEARGAQVVEQSGRPYFLEIPSR